MAISKGLWAGGAAVMAVAALWGAIMLRPATVPTQPLAGLPADADATLAPVPPEGGQDAETLTGPVGPTFDTVRIEAEGTSVIAGRAAPGVAVAVLLDGDEVARTVADRAGNFVVLLGVPPVETARSLALMADPDGTAVLSDATVLIAPAMPVVPDTAPEQAQTAAGEIPLVPLAPVQPAAGVSEPRAATALSGAAAGEVDVAIALDIGEPDGASTAEIPTLGQGELAVDAVPDPEPLALASALTGGESDAIQAPLAGVETGEAGLDNPVDVDGGPQSAGPAGAMADAADAAESVEISNTGLIADSDAQQDELAAPETLAETGPELVATVAAEPAIAEPDTPVTVTAEPTGPDADPEIAEGTAVLAVPTASADDIGTAPVGGPAVSPEMTALSGPPQIGEATADLTDAGPQTASADDGADPLPPRTDLAMTAFATLHPGDLDGLGLPDIAPDPQTGLTDDVIDPLLEIPSTGAATVIPAGTTVGVSPSAPADEVQRDQAAAPLADTPSDALPAVRPEPPPADVARAEPGMAAVVPLPSDAVLVPSPRESAAVSAAVAPPPPGDPGPDAAIADLPSLPQALLTAPDTPVAGPPDIASPGPQTLSNAVAAPAAPAPALSETPPVGAPGPDAAIADLPSLPQALLTAPGTPVAGLPDIASPGPQSLSNALPAPAAPEVLTEPDPVLSEPLPVGAPEPLAGDTDPVIAAPVGTEALPDTPQTDPVARPPVLVADASGVRVLQPAIAPGAAAEVLATVALDAISYNDGGEVFLAGRARVGAGGTFVRIYVDNIPVAVGVVAPDGTWESGLPDVPPGVYTMRVDQVDASGAVTSRIESPFQREAPAALAAAMAEQTGEGFGGVAVKTVQPGHTLWAIARERYGDGIMYVNVFAANRDRIRNPDLIYPGQVFVLPEIEGQPVPSP